MAEAPNLDFEEWKSCIDQINKFDGYLVDLRKYGFTIITGLATAGSFLAFQSPTQNIQVGVLVANIVLVGILYWIDQYYQNLLYGAVSRGFILEAVLDRGLISDISDFNRDKTTSIIFNIALVYTGFTIALFVLGLIATFAQSSGGELAPHSLQIILSIAFTLTIIYILAVHTIVGRDRNKKYNAVKALVDEKREEINAQKKNVEDAKKKHSEHRQRKIQHRREKLDLYSSAVSPDLLERTKELSEEKQKVEKKGIELESESLRLAGEQASEEQKLTEMQKNLQKEIRNIISGRSLRSQK